MHIWQDIGQAVLVSVKFKPNRIWTRTTSPYLSMWKFLPSTGCGFYCWKPDNLNGTVSFLSYPHHGADPQSTLQRHEMSTPRMIYSSLSRIVPQQVLTYPPTSGFHWWVGNTDLKWEQIQAIYLLSHMGGPEVVFQKRANCKGGRFTLGPVAQLVSWPVAHAYWHASCLEAKPGREKLDLSLESSSRGWIENVCCFSRHSVVPW